MTGKNSKKRGKVSNYHFACKLRAFLTVCKLHMLDVWGKNLFFKVLFVLTA
jgi:hypothetical protein